MSISASVASNPITARVSGVATSVAASPSGSRVSAGSTLLHAIVASQQLVATASGGIGPPGSAGPAGAAGPAASIELAADVLLEAPADGDVLRYSSSRWRNHPELQLTDGGSF